MVNKCKIMIVSSGGPEETVFESQVLDIMKAWRKYGEVSLLYRSSVSKQIKIKNASVKRINKIVPQLSRVLLHIERFLNPQWRISANLDIIHCRGPVGAWQVLHSLNTRQRKSVKVLYDCRGIVVEEMAGMWKDSWRSVFLPLQLREMRLIEKYVVNKVDLVTTVSKGLSDYLEEHYGRRPDQIIRPIVDENKFFFSLENRKLVRDELGVNSDDVMFLFVGGGAFWQSLHLIKEWWVKIRKERYTLLILSHNPDDYAGWLSDVSTGLGQVIVKSVQHNQVSSYMSAADYGILFRDDNLVNKVASPVKLGEYLSTGLQVLTNLPLYQQIQPKDVLLIDLFDSFKQADYQRREYVIRDLRAQENRRIFSAEHAVDQIYELARNSSLKQH